MGKIEAILELFVHDEKGRLTQHHKQEAKCFVIQFLEIIYSGWAEQHYNITNILGAEVSWDNRYKMPVNGIAGVDNEGIVVGTGTTAVAWDDYKLETQIVHGVGGGQLSYGAEAHNIPVWNSPYIELVETRPFQNVSGATITVTEIGMYAQHYTGTTDASARCIIRDVLAASVDVPNGQTLTVQYTIRVQP